MRYRKEIEIGRMKYLLFYRQSYNVYDDDDEMGEERV